MATTTARLWNVYLEARGELSEAGIDKIIDELKRGYGPSVSGGPGFPTFGLTITVSAASAPASATKAVEVLSKVHHVSWKDIVKMEVQRQADLEEDLKRPTFPRLVGVSEAARILRVSRQRVWEIAQQGRLPKPLATLKAGPIWQKSAILAFAEEWARVRKNGRPRKRIEKTA